MTEARPKYSFRVGCVPMDSVDTAMGALHEVSRVMLEMLSHACMRQCSERQFASPHEMGVAFFTRSCGQTIRRLSGRREPSLHKCAACKPFPLH